MGGRAGVLVEVYGDIAVTASGRKLTLPASKKTRALLGYLVVTGKPQLREHLCDLLWQGPDDPRGALRWSLTKLRGVLGEACLQADRERVAFVAERATSDVATVRAAIAGGVAEVPTRVLADVSAQFRGELLEGLDLPDCYRYHEWCVAQREAARRERALVLSALVERHAASPETALGYARQRLAVDPTAEACHVAVVALLTALGRHREAAEQADACKRILARELGTTPSAALVAARVRTEAAPAPARAGGEALAAPPSADDGGFALADSVSAPFVGRPHELDALQEAWRTALAARSERAWLITGEPGMGKTRLAAELAAKAAASGGRILRGRAFEAEMVRPYGPWIDALRGAPLGDEERPFGDAADRGRVFERVAGALRAASSSGGCLVVLDDLQWFDEVSAALLHFVVRELSPGRVLVVCTARGDELAENAAAIRSVRALQREGRLEELALGPLDPLSTAAIARAAFAKADAEGIAAESAGNPLFALELARERGSRTEAVDSLQTLLRDRLERLDPRAQEILPWAAALGRGFSPDLLGRVTQATANDLLTALEGLERRGVLRAEEGGYDFSHDLLRGAAYRRLSTARRGFVHQRIARVLAEVAVTDPSLHGDAAHHAALAGDHEMAARSSIAAADRCVRIFAYDEAARLAESGLVHADRLTGKARIAARVALLSVKVLSGRWLRRAHELLTDVSRAVLEARDAGMDAEALRGLYYLSMLQRDRGDLLGAHHSTLEAAAVSRTSGTELRARQLAHSAQCLALLERDMEHVPGMIEEASQLMDPNRPDVALAFARGVLSRYLDGADAASLLERSLALARRDDDHSTVCESLMQLTQLALDRGNPAQALAWCRELTPVAAKMSEGSEGAIAEALEALARVALCAAGAEEHLERAIERLRDIDSKGMLAYVLASAADVDRAAGRVERAQGRATEALSLAEVVQRRTLVAFARASLAEIALARGDQAEARSHLAALSGDLSQPLAISAIARARVARVARRIGM
jgi:DNA-binding SARP family transcriptional activator